MLLEIFNYAKIGCNGKGDFLAVDFPIRDVDGAGIPPERVPVSLPRSTLKLKVFSRGPFGVSRVAFQIPAASSATRAMTAKVKTVSMISGNFRVITL